VCICTGTDDGQIASITDMSSLIPQLLSLSTLTDDYEQYWREMTDHRNSVMHASIVYEPCQLVNSLVFASHKIPRLLLVAHDTWCRHQLRVDSDREFVLQQFEVEATKYCPETLSVWANYCEADIAHIILSCGCHWPVNNIDSSVPGTTISWRSLIQRSLVFPYDSDCFCFPFNLVWRETRIVDRELAVRKKSLERFCQEKVPGLVIKDMFISYLDLCKCDLFNLGMCYESLFVSSMYYLLVTATHPASSLVHFHQLYAFSDAEARACALLADTLVDFSSGIHLPLSECLVEDDIPPAVTHNRKHRKHDIIFHTNNGALPVSAKAVVEDQLRITKNDERLVPLLIWLSLGADLSESQFPQVACIEGSGVCNGLSTDMFRLVKQLKSEK